MSDTGIKQAETLNTNPSPIVTIQTESDSGYFSEDTSESSLSESPRIYTEDGVLGSPKKGKSEESSQSSSVEEGDPTTKKKKKKTLFKNMFWRSNDTLPQLLEEVKVSKDVKEEPRRIRGFEKIKGFLLDASPPENSGTVNALISPRFVDPDNKQKKVRDDSATPKEELEKKKTFLPFRKKSVSGLREDHVSRVYHARSSSMSSTLLPTTLLPNAGTASVDPSVAEEDDYVLPSQCKDSLENLMKDPVALRKFYNFCVKEHSEVNILFLAEAVAFQRGDQPSEMRTVQSAPIVGVSASTVDESLHDQAESLYYEFIEKDAPNEITIHPSLQNQLAKQVQSSDCRRDMFDKVFDDISLDSFKRFCQAYDKKGALPVTPKKSTNKVTNASGLDDSPKIANTNLMSTSTPSLPTLRGSPKHSPRHDSRPIVPQLHLQSLSHSPSPSSLAASLPSAHLPQGSAAFSMTNSPRELGYSPRLGTVVDSSPRLLLHNEKYGIAFGIKRGACTFPCDCEYYQPQGDSGGQCQNCGHFPATHQNLGKVESMPPPLDLNKPDTINDLSPRTNDVATGSPTNVDEITVILPQVNSNWVIDADEINFIEKIGEGTAAKVYKGVWRNQEVAIKVLKNMPDGKEMQEFSKEVEIMSLLRSPCIVYFYGMTLKPKVCMVMEYCARKSIYHVMLSKMDFTWDRVLAFSTDAVRGINSLHNWNPPILHRDLKTLNLLVTDNWAVKIADFGLSRFTTGDLATLSKVRGTYAYCAPEVYFGKQFTTKSDIYSMGIVLWELITRCMRGRYERPFAEFKHIQYDFQIIIQSAKENLRPTIPPNCPEVLINLIKMCWDPNPDLRPSSAQVLEVLTELETVYQENKKKWDKLREKIK